MKLSLTLVCLFSILFSSRAEPPRADATHPRPLTADEAVSEVLAGNPALKAARLRWEAMKERPQIAGSLPDPMLMYGYFLENVETRVGAQNQKVGLSQKIPFPGKLSLAAKKARQEAIQGFWQYQTLGRELVMRAKLAWYDLYRVDETRRILQEQADLYEHTIHSARTKYEAGSAQQQDVLKAELAQTEIEKRVLELGAQREAAQARLNALRNVTGHAPVSTRRGLALESTPVLSRAVALSLQYRQELSEAQVAIERNETALALARKERWPDITLGIDYTQVNRNIFVDPPDNGHDAVLASVSINLPIWFGKLNAQEREARMNLAASRAAARNTANNVDADVRDAWFQARTARDQLALYREKLLPQAQQTYDASQAGYEGAKVSFIDLLESEQALLNYRMGLVLSETDLAKAHAMLERAIGIDLKEAGRAGSAVKAEVSK